MRGLDGTLSPSFEAARAQNLKNIARPIVKWIRASESRSGDILDVYSLRPVLRARGHLVRLETRLVDPERTMIWAHKSDSNLYGVFDWHDSVAADISDHGLGLTLEAETTRLAAIPDDQLTAEQRMLMGIIAQRTFEPLAFVRSVTFHDHAINANPDMAYAYAEAIIVVLAARTMTNNPQMRPFIAKIPSWAEAARPLSAGKPMLTLAIAIATYTQDQRPSPLRQAVAQTLRLAPFDARALCFCGWANLWGGQTQDALDCFLKSLNFGRLGLFYVASLGGASAASVQLGCDAQAIDFANQGLAIADGYPTYYSAKSAAVALLGRLGEAEEVMQQYLTLEPGRTVQYKQSTNNYGGSEGGKRYFDGQRLAGLPEK